MSDKLFSKKHIDFIATICSEAGIKLTHQRLEIFREIIRSDDHPSAEVLHDRLKKRNPSLAIDTVYRTLATFEQLGLINKLHVMGERALFDKNLDQHHHFVCTKCKRVHDIYWPEFDSSAPPAEVTKLGNITSQHLEIRGICNKCNQDTHVDS